MGKAVHIPLGRGEDEEHVARGGVDAAAVNRSFRRKDAESFEKGQIRLRAGFAVDKFPYGFAVEQRGAEGLADTECRLMQPQHALPPGHGLEIFFRCRAERRDDVVGNLLYHNTSHCSFHFL